MESASNSRVQSRADSYETHSSDAPIVALPKPGPSSDPGPSSLYTRLSRTMSQILEKPHHAPHSPPQTHAPLASPERLQSQSPEPTSPTNENEGPSTELSPTTHAASESHNNPLAGPSKFQRLRKRINPTLLLENQGSVARDHLASERTFLAYVRTSLAIASTGVALVQLFSVAASAKNDNATDFTQTRPPLSNYARPLGATSIIFGLIVLSMGLYRYFLVQKALITGMFPASRFGLMAVGVVLGAVFAIVFGLLVSNPGG